MARKTSDCEVAMKNAVYTLPTVVLGSLSAARSVPVTIVPHPPPMASRNPPVAPIIVGFILGSGLRRMLLGGE